METTVGEIIIRQIIRIEFPLSSKYQRLENNPKQICTLIGIKPCFYNSTNTELAPAVDVMKARPKRIYTLMIAVKNVFLFLSAHVKSIS